jgi:hypothetical protein
MWVAAQSATGTYLNSIRLSVQGFSTVPDLAPTSKMAKELTLGA